MEEKEKGICCICEKEKTGKNHRYPGLKSYFYCDDCFKEEIKRAQKGSVLGIAVSAGPVLIALIVDLILSKVNGSEFGLIFVGTWIVIGLLISLTKYPSRFIAAFAGSLIATQMLHWEYGERGDSIEDGAMKSGLVIVMQIVFSMISVVYVAAKNLGILINTILFKKNVNEVIITIVYIATFLLSILAVVLTFMLVTGMI